MGTSLPVSLLSFDLPFTPLPHPSNKEIIIISVRYDIYYEAGDDLLTLLFAFRSCKLGEARAYDRNHNNGTLYCID